MAFESIAEEYRQVAQDLLAAHRGEDGMTVKRALMNFGIAEKQACKGWVLLKTRKALRTAFEAAKIEAYSQFAEQAELTAEQDQRIINSRLRQNILNGEDKAVQSAKTLGSRKDLNMWTADSVAGVIIMELPNSLPKVDIEAMTIEASVD